SISGIRYTRSGSSHEWVPACCLRPISDQFRRQRRQGIDSAPFTALNRISGSHASSFPESVGLSLLRSTPAPIFQRLLSRSAHQARKFSTVSSGASSKV